MHRSPATPMRSERPRARRQVSAIVLVVLAVSMASAVTLSCSRTSGTVVVEGSGSAEPEGPVPTMPAEPRVPAPTTTAPAPPTVPAGPLSVDDLVVQIDGLVTGNRLCALLTGSALERLSVAGLDTASLLADPAAFTKLIGALGRVFGHMVTIAPSPEVRADLEVLRGAWVAAAGIDPRAPDAAVRAEALVSDPAVQQSQAGLTEWARLNCPG